MILVSVTPGQMALTLTPERMALVDRHIVQNCTHSLEKL